MGQVRSARQGCKEALVLFELMIYFHCELEDGTLHMVMTSESRLMEDPFHDLHNLYCQYGRMKDFGNSHTAS